MRFDYLHDTASIFDSHDTVHSLLICGRPRSGKQYGLRRNRNRWANRRSGAMLCKFPIPKENGPFVTKEMHAEGHGRRTFFDSLESTTHCLPLLFFPKDNHPDPFIRAARNIDGRDGLIDILGRGRPTPIEDQVTVIELLTHAIDLCMKATMEVTFEHLLAVGKPGHPLYHALMDTCPDMEEVWFWNRIPKQGLSVRNDLGALWRLLDQKLNDPRILCRQTNRRVILDMLRKLFIVIIEGCRSRRATRTYMGLTGMSYKQALNDNFADTGTPLNLWDESDEAQSSGQFTSYESQCLREMPKMGLYSVVSGHGTRLLSDPLENAEALALFEAVQIYACGDWRTALGCAQLAFGPAIDLYREHHVDERTVQRHAGWQSVISYSNSSGRNTRKGESPEDDQLTYTDQYGESERLIPILTQVKEQTSHYFTTAAQFEEVAAGLMGFGKRQRLTRVFGDVRWETVPLMDEPWSIPELGAVQLATFLKEMHQRPEFKKPSIGTPVVRLSSPSFESTSPSSAKSSNGANGHKSTKSFSDPTKALLDVLQRSGKTRGAP